MFSVEQIQCRCYPLDAMALRVPCLSVTSRSSTETDEPIELFLARELPSTYPMQLRCVIRKLEYFQ